MSNPRANHSEFNIVNTNYLKTDITPVRRRRLRSLADLAGAELLPVGDEARYIQLAGQYDIGISDHVRSLIQKTGRPEKDVIGRQYIPTLDELNVLSDEESDPIGDEIYTPVNGIVHRYEDRVLFKVTNVCAVYCRYCFRREMVGAGAEHLSDEDFDRAIAYIKSHDEIWEVILTGGDPFVLSPRRLQKVIEALNKIEHVKIIRIHTRTPVADPTLISDTILSVLKLSAKPIYIVLHINHAKEITEEVVHKISRLRAVNCSILSQSVLLRGVNDDAITLENLFRKLVTLHVQPYYLHHLDRAKGTSHFRVSLTRGQEIMKDLQGRVSGICLPKYMLDIPGGHGKIPVNESYVQVRDGDVYSVEDYQGCTHLYFDTVPTNRAEK
ncbi:MAG: lysine 2,3-aminomutase [Alphaproteobacteria bacterium]|nr:MAG: lysine 2,3-aminomutase [Alphaproteobacteria bacterium]